MVNGKYQLKAYYWDEEAFMVILNIVHLRNKKVPRDVSFEMLAKVSV